MKSMFSYFQGSESSEMEMESGDVPQSEPLSDDQVLNSAGGHVWEVDDMQRLRRFLCLGSEGGTFYIEEQQLGLENAECIQRLVEKGKGEDVVKEIVSFSVEGRAAKQNPIIFAFAMCARQDKDEKVKKLCYEKLHEVLRIPTHLFHFVEYSEKLSRGTGWGRAHRRAISKWYLRFSKKPKQLAQHVTKYKQRNGWSHRDVLRLAHPKPEDEATAAVLKYVIKGLEEAKKQFLTNEADGEMKDLFTYLQDVEDVKVTEDAEKAVALIHRSQLVREHIPTALLNEASVWRELLQKMPLTAMLRNLGKMSNLGLLDPGTDETRLVCEKLADEVALKQARVHPFNMLVALQTYSKGKGELGKLSWPVNDAIKHALNDAFYKTFKFVEPTNKRYCLAMDVSMSMAWTNVNGCPSITPRDASSALAMVTARTERDYEMIAFSTTLVPLKINADMRLEDVVKNMQAVPMGGTDCAQPMLWAKEKNKKFDVFVVYTDCETWAGDIHPAEALRQYREHSGIWDAKLIVCAMTSNKFTLADPNDPGMLDMAGFDSSGPEIMRNFSLGLL
jgi:60 kDa SS-A/Ro ribonucleoprotein